MNKDITDMNISEFAPYYKELCDEAGIDTTDESLVSTVVIKFLEELIIYKKALDLACKELETHPYSQWDANEWFNYFSQKVREE